MPAALEGLKMVDIGWIMVGPVSARYLTELGVATIKAETAKRPDPLRGLGPFRDGKPGLERSLSYHLTNAGKRGLAIDVKSEAGLDIVRRLVTDADIFVESFTPGAIDGMSLSYEVLSKANPGLIMVSTGILGRKGTMGLGMSGTGMTGSAFAGATNLMGWPDQAPVGPYGPWTDAVTPRFIASAVLAALHRRHQTGQGVHIDVAQSEAGLQFLTPAYFDYAVNGNVAGRVGGLADPLRVPCGAYRCLGEDRWVVIDAADAQAFSALRQVVGAALADAAFDTLVGRLRARTEIDRRLGAWTASQTPRQVEETCQAAGVPAHAVCDDEEMFSDPDLTHSGFYREVDDPVVGRSWLPGPQYVMHGTPHVPTRAGPRIGDANDEILKTELGMSVDEIARLREAGVLG
jgi:benzylsuccinate CoA-transferase BbsF subunit